MTWQFDTANLIGANRCAEGVYQIKTFLLAHGATIRSSSDGSHYEAAGDYITSGASGAHGLNNASAWIVLQWHGAEWAIQRGSGSSANLWIRMSVSGFTTGSPDATTMPTAADVQNVHGSNATGAAFAMAATSYLHMWCDDAAPYPWYAVTLADATGEEDGVLQFMPLAPWSYPAEDAAPFLCFKGATSSAYESTTIGAEASGPVGWWRHGEVNVAFDAFYWFAGNLETTGMNAEGRTPMYPIVMARLESETPPGPKGIPVGIFCTGKATPWPNGDTLSVGGEALNYICVGEVALPWDGSVPGHLTAPSTDHEGEIVYGPGATVADTTPPVISDVVPAPGRIAANAWIYFSVTDETELRRVFVIARYPGAIAECVWDGSDWDARYEHSIATIADGVRIGVRERGGWRAAPVVRVRASDTAGNEDA